MNRPAQGSDLTATKIMFAGSGEEQGGVCTSPAYSVLQGECWVSHVVSLINRVSRFLRSCMAGQWMTSWRRLEKRTIARSVECSGGKRWTGEI